jgi:hypothetical protein
MIPPANLSGSSTVKCHRAMPTIDQTRTLMHRMVLAARAIDHGCRRPISVHADPTSEVPGSGAPLGLSPRNRSSPLPGSEGFGDVTRRRVEASLSKYRLGIDLLVEPDSSGETAGLRRLFKRVPADA